MKVHCNQRTRQLKKIQKNTNNSSRVNAITQLQSMADNYVKKTENRTELPNNIKSGVENLSGALLNEFKTDCMSYTRLSGVYMQLMKNEMKRMQID